MTAPLTTTQTEGRCCERPRDPRLLRDGREISGDDHNRSMKVVQSPQGEERPTRDSAGAAIEGIVMDSDDIVTQSVSKRHQCSAADQSTMKSTRSNVKETKKRERV
jgi:hypothetical protein